jgi:hypothetical protein
LTRLRILFLYLGFLALLLIGTYLFLRESGVARTFVVNALAGFVEPGQFSLRDANLDIRDGRVVLHGLEIATPADQPGRARLAVDRVDVGVDTNPLGEVGRVRSLRLSGMRLELDLVEGRFPDLQRILLPRPDAGAAAQPPPPVEVVDSSLSLLLAPGAGRIEFTDLQLELLPEAPGSFRCALRGSMRAPQGRRVTVEGAGDLSTPSFRAVLRIEDVPLSPELARPYSAEAVDFLAGIGIGGRAGTITLWAEYPDTAAAAGVEPTAVAGVRLELDDLRCAVPALPYPIVGATATIAADLRDGGTLAFVVEDRSVNGNLDGQGRVSDLFSPAPRAEIQVEARDVLVGPTLSRALATLPDARDVWDAFQPTGGRADASLHFESGTATARERLALEIRLSDVGARFVGFETPDGTRERGFPFPMEDIRGTIRLHDGEVTIDDVRARLGEHEIRLRGHVLPRPGRAPELEFDLRSDEIAFSPRIREALGVFDPDFAAVYDDYAPAGTTALEVEVRTGADRDDPGVRVRLLPLGASAAWNGFPYRIEQVTGLVDIGTDGVFLELEGTRGPTTIALNGRFPSAAGPGGVPAGPEALLRASARGVAIDDELRRAMRALSDTLGETVDLLGLGGTCAIDLTTWRDAGAADFGYDVRVDLERAEIHLENLPLPTRDLRGPVFVHGEGTRSRVEVASVQGWIDNGPDTVPAPLVLHGTVDAEDGDYAADLAAVVRGLQLNERLGLAVDEFGAFDIDTWNMLRPAGDVDVVWQQTREFGAAEARQSLRIQLLDARSAAPFLPAPAEQIYGDVRVVDGIATFSDIRARMAGAEVQCASGSARRDADRSVFEAVVSSEDFPVDDRLANLLDGPLKRTYLDRRIRGRVRVHELRMQLELPEGDGSLRTRLSARLSALGLRLELGTQVEDLTGLWTIEEVDVGPDRGTARGSVEGGGFAVFAHRVSDAQASFFADNEHVEFAGLQARLHGGTIRGRRPEAALLYRLSEPGELSFDLGWDGISLEQMARAAGVRDERFRGRVSGHLTLDRLVGTDLVDAVGSGELVVTEGDMGQVPAFTTIYSYLDKPRRPRFEDLKLRFAVADQRIEVPELQIASQLLTATGRGRIDMDGYVDMRIDFPDFFGKDSDWLFLPQMLRMLTNELAEFQIYGYLRAPKIRPLWLWRDAAERLALSPIPAATPDRDEPGNGPRPEGERR